MNTVQVALPMLDACRIFAYDRMPDGCGAETQIGQLCPDFGHDLVLIGPAGRRPAGSLVAIAGVAPYGACLLAS